MQRACYPSDLSDDGYTRVAPLLRRADREFPRVSKVWVDQRDRGNTGRGREWIEPELG